MWIGIPTFFEGQSIWFFNEGTDATVCQKIQLKKLGKGQKPKAAKAVSADEENLMWEKGQPGDSSPRTLIFSVWYYFTKCFGLWGRNEHRQLLLGDVVLKKDPVNGREFLEYSERMTETWDGTGKDNRKVKPRLYGNGTERDPLELYKMYLERRPEKAMNPGKTDIFTSI